MTHPYRPATPASDLATWTHHELRAEVERLRGLLTRCETILGNMALENEGAIFNRWPISHEPLRSDARNLLPLIKQATKEPNETDN